MNTSPKRSTILRASFDYHLGESRVLVLYDTLAPRSLTNDMEPALRDVAQLEGLSSLAGCQVIYRDSESQWAGVHLDAQGQFQGFYGLGAAITTEAQALEVLTRLKGTQPSGN